MELKTRIDRWWADQDAHLIDLLRGTSVAGLLKALSAVLSFGLSVVLGRILGAEGAGVYFLAVTVATVASTIGRVGLDSAVLRFVATSASSGAWSDVTKTYNATLMIGLTGSSLVALIMFVMADFLADYVFAGSIAASPIRVAALSVVPLSIGVLISGSLLGLSRIRDSLLVLSIMPSGIALICTWSLASRWAVNGAIAAYVIAVVVAMIYGAVMWRLAMTSQATCIESKPVASRSPTLLAVGVPLLIGALLQLVMHSSGTVMLGMWSDKSDVSHYAVAWRTAALISFVLIAVNTIAQPKFAALYASSEMAALASTARKANVLMMLCAVPVVLLFLICPAFVMGLFGADFSDGAVALQVLSIGQFVNVAMGSVGVLLVMTAREREYRNVQFASAGIVLVLNVALIPRFGAAGAAVAAASGLIVQNLLFAYYVWSRLGIFMLSSKPYRQRSGTGHDR